MVIKHLLIGMILQVGSLRVWMRLDLPPQPTQDAGSIVTTRDGIRFLGLGIPN